MEPAPVERPGGEEKGSVPEAGEQAAAGAGADENIGSGERAEECIMIRARN